MIAPKEACKYLISYPFSPLSIAKAHNILQYIASLVCWRIQLPSGGFFPFLLPLSDILGLAIAVVSLWFMVQKFYWKKLEMGMNTVAVAMTTFALFTIIFHSSLGFAFFFIHLFVLSAWSFCLWWSWKMTKNTVSNLFISNWGEATTEIEIEALEEHF